MRRKNRGVLAMEAACEPVAAAIAARLLQPIKIGRRIAFELPLRVFAFAQSAFGVEFVVVGLRQPEQGELSAEAMADDVSR